MMLTDVSLIRFQTQTNFSTNLLYQRRCGLPEIIFAQIDAQKMNT